MSVKNASGGRSPQTFYIEAYQTRGAAWEYQLKDSKGKGKLHDGGRWFAEGDLSAPKSTK